MEQQGVQSMAEEKNQLLNNQLDALDRLFDRKTEVVDLHAITYATAQALRTDPLFPLFEETAKALEKVIRAGTLGDQARDQALYATNQLRMTIADLAD